MCHYPWTDCTGMWGWSGDLYPSDPFRCPWRLMLAQAAHTGTDPRFPLDWSAGDTFWRGTRQPRGAPAWLVWCTWRVVLPQVELRGGFVHLRKKDPLRRCHSILSLWEKENHLLDARPACLCLSVYLWEYSEFPGWWRVSYSLCQWLVENCLHPCPIPTTAGKITLHLEQRSCPQSKESRLPRVG